MRTAIIGLLLVAAAGLGGCSDSTDNDNGDGPGNGNGNGNGAPGTVVVGNDFFRSGNNGTQNPAVDTVAAGATVTWTWTGTTSTSHSVRSMGTPSFTSSAIMTGDGSSYGFTFTTPGTYHYDCAVHGSAMTGTVVVQ
jgi:plastocyanin